MFKQWSQYIGATAAILLVSALALLVIMLGAQLLQSTTVLLLDAAEWTDKSTVQATFTAKTIMNTYYVVFGILYLGFFILMDHLLITTGIPQKRVLRRAAFTAGVELLILFLFQAGMMLYLPTSPLQIGLAAGEALLGVGFIVFARRKVTLPPTS